MVDWGELALEKGGRLNILGNLPYYITSQVLFSLADHHNAIRTAVVTMQLEVLTVSLSFFLSFFPLFFLYFFLPSFLSPFSAF